MRVGALMLLVLVSAVAVPLLFNSPAPAADTRLNVVVIMTDDQPFDTLPHDPPLMPFLQSRLEAQNDHWIQFSNAFVEVPLCCPSRATVLSGRYSHNTGVHTNEDGHLFDDSSTLATWLHDAGYTTALVGKYLNLYPFGRGPFVPPGWDRWDGKEQGDETSLYRNFTLVQDGTPVFYGADSYSTDVFNGLAVDFINQAPAERPFFLYLTPTAPHAPWLPAPRHAGALDGVSLAPSPSVWETDVSDKPAWVQALPLPTPARRAKLEAGRRHSYETLLALDESVHSIIDALKQKGVLDNTVILYLTDNGFSFGEHRWVTKRCPYDECIRTPFVVRMPGAVPRTEQLPVSLVDLAPTIAELAGIEPPSTINGLSFASALRGQVTQGWPEGQLSEFIGDGVVPQWWALRTERFAYVEYVTGERELYNTVLDPHQFNNVIDDPIYASDVERLAAQLAAFRKA